MFWPPDQFFISMTLLRGLAAMGEKISPHKQIQKLTLAKLLIAELVSPTNISISTPKKAMYMAEIKMYCPELFNARN